MFKIFKILNWQNYLSIHMLLKLLKSNKWSFENSYFWKLGKFQLQLKKKMRLDDKNRNLQRSPSFDIAIPKSQLFSITRRRRKATWRFRRGRERYWPSV